MSHDGSGDAPHLNSPGGVCVLRNVADRIDRPNFVHCEEKPQEAKESAAAKGSACPPLEQTRYGAFRAGSRLFLTSFYRTTHMHRGLPQDRRVSDTPRCGSWEAFHPHSSRYRLRGLRGTSKPTARFLQFSIGLGKCSQICSKPRRSAMVTAWVRSLA